jgi:hypothetical protein
MPSLRHARWIVLALCAAPLSAQAVWRRMTPGARAFTGIAYDEVRQVAIGYGGRPLPEYAPSYETWRYNGTAWSLASTTGPQIFGPAPLVFDSGRGRVVLFGYGLAGTAQTWEWDGSAWSQVNASGPSGRLAHAMAYDSGRGRVVLFGGQRTNAPLGDTWEFDGMSWQLMSPANNPPARAEAAMAYDPIRRVTVLFGGRNAGTTLQDTWTWDGSNWTQVATSGPQLARGGAALAFNPRLGRVVLFGGHDGVTVRNDEWSFDGTTWVVQTGLLRPPARVGHGMAWDTARGRMLLSRGCGLTRSIGNQLEDLTDTWEWDGQAWRMTDSEPGARGQHAMAFDATRGRLLLFGGNALLPGDGPLFADTWELDDSHWTQKFPNHVPAARRFHALFYDPDRAEVVLYGGLAAWRSQPFSDTWVWDGTDWIQRSPAQSPGPSWRDGMFFDPVRRRVSLYSGATGHLWDWDGSNWTRRGAAPGPLSPYFALAYDTARQRVVLVVPVGLAQTWEFDGTSWQRRTSVHAPPAGNTEMAYDPARARVVQFCAVPAGLDGYAWEWDGVDWSQRGLGPLARGWASLVWDGGRERLLLYGGASGLPLADEWEYATTAPARFDVFGQGCAGSAGTPLLSAVNGQRPWAGDRFEVAIAPVAAGSFVLGLLGTSRSSWFGQFPLPLSLGAIGAPACSLLVQGNVVQFLGASTGSLRWALDLPGAPSLVGQPFFLQALILDPPANPPGLVTTSGAELQPGVR